MHCKYFYTAQECPGVPQKIQEYPSVPLGIRNIWDILGP